MTFPAVAILPLLFLLLLHSLYFPSTFPLLPFYFPSTSPLLVSSIPCSSSQRLPTLFFSSQLFLYSPTVSTIPARLYICSTSPPIHHALYGLLYSSLLGTSPLFSICLFCKRPYLMSSHINKIAYTLIQRKFALYSLWPHDLFDLIRSSLSTFHPKILSDVAKKHIHRVSTLQRAIAKHNRTTHTGITNCHSKTDGQQPRQNSNASAVLGSEYRSTEIGVIQMGC